MKREGPCYHCGIAYTPLWRNGPTEKPVLCNACGSRWRIRGTLADYIPKHASKENQGRKLMNEEEEETEPNFSSLSFADGTTNKSRSSSTSSSEACVHAEIINGLDEFKIWEKESVPRRKRSVPSQYVFSSVGRLHKDLLHIMSQQEVFTQPEEEDELIYENTTNLFSSFPETAYGSMLLQLPNPETEENQRESLGTEKETKSESPITETEIKPEFTFTQKKTACSVDISLEQLSSKSIPPSNQVAQKKNCSLCVRKRGRPRKGSKHTACHKCTSSRYSQDESAYGGKDVHIHNHAPSEARAVSSTDGNRGRQLEHNQTNKEEGNQLNSNIEGGACIEGEALVDVPLLSSLNLGSEIVRQQYHSSGMKK